MLERIYNSLPSLHYLAVIRTNQREYGILLSAKQALDSKALGRRIFYNMAIYGAKEYFYPHMQGK